MKIAQLDIKGDRVLVKQLSDSDKVGSFYIPDSVAKRREKRRADAWKAEVIAIGDMIDFERLKGTLKKGDIVYCSPVSLDCPKLEGDDGCKYIIVTQEDLIAKECK
jgi:co-chaperonin GroES (HSP10)